MPITDAVPIKPRPKRKVKAKLAPQAIKDGAQPSLAPIADSDAHATAAASVSGASPMAEAAAVVFPACRGFLLFV